MYPCLRAVCFCFRSHSVWLAFAQKTNQLPFKLHRRKSRLTPEQQKAAIEAQTQAFQKYRGDHKPPADAVYPSAEAVATPSAAVASTEVKAHSSMDEAGVATTASAATDCGPSRIELEQALAAAHKGHEKSRVFYQKQLAEATEEVEVCLGGASSGGWLVGVHVTCGCDAHSGLCDL